MVTGQLRVEYRGVVVQGHCLFETIFSFDSASWLPIRVVLVVMSVRWGVVSF